MASQRNAFQNALDLVKSGALRTMAASPMGQFASKVGQATSFLRAPSMEDLGNAYNQSVGRASSFVQKYPSPASYVAQRMPQVPQVQSYSPTKTFQENMKLMNPAYQLTQENTPVSKFLINKIGGPGQDIFTGKLEGPQTATNYLARSFESTIPGLMPITPYVPTIISGLKATTGLLPKIASTAMELSTFNPQMKMRNVLKEGFNIPAAAVGATLGLAYQGGMKMLKGEKLSPEEASSATLITGLIGSVLPSPMKGIATTALGAARKTLSEYGFNLSDYESPALLKTKFNRFVLKNHPDKFATDPVLMQQKTEELKSFIDAFNKATSAGIDSSWKLPDIVGWVRNLWTKKQQPTGGSMVRVGQPAPTTATEGLFGKIADVVRKESRVDFHTFEGPQIRTVLKKAGLDMIPEGTVETPRFIVQYRKKDYLGNPIPPILQVNLFPVAQQFQPPAQPVVPQVVPQPSVQPSTSVAQVPKAPIVTQPIQVPNVTTPSQPLAQEAKKIAEQVESAKYILKMNTFKDFEIKGLLGKNPKYSPQGYSPEVWKQASKDLGLTEKSFVEGTTGNFHIRPSTRGEIGKGVEGAPVSSFEDEPLSPLANDYIRKIRRTVNEDEKIKLAQMKNSEINAYVEQSNQDQPVITAPVASSTPVPQVPAPPPPPPEKLPLGKQGPFPGEKKFKFLQSLLDAETITPEMKQQMDEKIYKYYKVKGNEQTFTEARTLLESDREGVVAEIMSGKPLNETLNATGQLLVNQLQYEQNFGRAIEIAESLIKNGPHAGRAVQIYSTIDKLTPTGMLYYADKTLKEAQKEMNSVDKALGMAGRHIEEAPQIAKQVTDQLNKINESVADQIAREVKQKSKTIKTKREMIPEEQLAKRVETYIKSLEAKKKENDPIRNMVNTLYKVAREVLPIKESIPQDPLLFIKEAIQNKEKYKNVWNEARNIVAKEFEGNESALELLDNYFEHQLDRPFAKSQIKQAVAGVIKETETDIGKLVRDWYVEKQEEYGKTLAKHLSEKAGLTEEDASMLEDYAVKRFRELTQKRKEQILASLVKSYPKLRKKEFLQKLYELSNLGAFSDKKYYDLIADRLKIPTLTESNAKKLFELSQKVQKTVEGSPEREALIREMTDFIAKKIPFGVLDWLESYRVNNILSGPGTQYRNAWTALTSSLFFAPTNLTIQSGMDWVRSFITHTPREIKFNTALYYFSVLKNIIPGGEAAWKSLAGKTLSENTDLQGLKFRRFRTQFPLFSIPTAVMEAVDQLGQVNMSRTISETLQAGGMEKEAADTKALYTAKDWLYRLSLDITNESGQGNLMTTIDKMTSSLLNFRRAAVISRFWIPFVIVPSQAFKKTIELSPFGFFAWRGANASAKRSHIANYIIGMAIMTWVLKKALAGETNWETPKDEKGRSLMRPGGANIPQYSIRVFGKYWVPIWFFGPALLSAAYPMAMKYYWADAPTAKTDNDFQKALRGVVATGVLFTKQTYMKGIGDMLSFINGNPDVNLEQVFLTNPLTSYSPSVGFTRWLSTIVDPTFRKTQSFWDGVLKSYPWATKMVEPYRTITGEEAKRNPYSIFLPWDIGTENPEGRYLFRERQIQVQDNKVINDMIKQIDVPEYIQNDSPQEIEYISTHPEAAFASSIRSLAKQLQTLNSQEISLYGEKNLTVAEKNDMYDSIVEQKKTVKDQLNYVWQEIQTMKGKPTKRNVFDEVQAVEYQKDTEVMAQSLQIQQQKLFEESNNALQKIKAIRDVSEKYKRLWPIFDMGVLRGTMDTAYTLSTKLGVDPSKAEYDYWTSRPARERREKLDDMIQYKTNGEIFNVLIPLRKESEGTGKPMLSEELVSDLIDDGIITKDQGKILKAMKTSRTTGELTIGASTGTSRLAYLKKISTLIEQRSVAYQKALRIRSPRLKIPKITFPKAPKIPRISARSLNVAPSRFVLRIPKRTSIKTSGGMQSLIRVRK